MLLQYVINELLENFIDMIHSDLLIHFMHMTESLKQTPKMSYQISLHRHLFRTEYFSNNLFARSSSFLKLSS